MLTPGDDQLELHLVQVNWVRVGVKLWNSQISVPPTAGVSVTASFHLNGSPVPSGSTVPEGGDRANGTAVG